MGNSFRSLRLDLNFKIRSILMPLELNAAIGHRYYPRSRILNLQDFRHQLRRLINNTQLDWQRTVSIPIGWKRK